MNKRFTIYLTLLISAFLIRSVYAEDVMTIEITSGVEQAIPIAIVPFNAAGDPEGLPLEISQIISDDLESSGYFKTMPAVDMPAQPHDFSSIMFDDWKRMGMDNLVVGKASKTASGSYAIEFRLADVYKGAQLTGLRVMARPDNLRFAAHQIADVIYEKLIGEPGAFATRVTYITVTKTGKKKRWHLEMSDADGHNPVTLLESSQPIMSPVWSPNGRQLAYVSFEEGNSSIFVQNIATGKRQVVSSGRGINSSPSWSPDNSKLAMTLSKDGNPEIYIKDLKTKKLSRVTNNRAIDTEASFSPDGRSLVFTSDRGGSPQIYKMPVSGGSAQRLTFNMGKYNAGASYSPDGKMLTFVHQESGAYQIAVLDLDYQQMNVLTSARLDESPSFAPNGKMIIYSTTRGYRSELAAISVDGKVEKRLLVKGSDVREPDWGPFVR
ncbi:MAG: Tol-Pal system beta propeller repeat protein TolB [Gammaproteobacteria bacterium]